MSDKPMTVEEIAVNFLKKYALFSEECQCDHEVNSTCVGCAMEMDLTEALLTFSSQQSAGLVDSLQECVEFLERTWPGDHRKLSAMNNGRKALAAYYLTHPKNPTKEGV